MDTISQENPVKIVIVDDHPNTASMLARVLTRFDSPVEIFTAANAEDALNQIGDEGMDILITDFMMPGMNGLELIEKLKGNQKPAHIILITAYDTPGLALSARRLNVKNYLVKPVQPDKIREIVKKAIDDLRPSEKHKAHLSPDRKFKILVADDHPDNLRLLSARLENEGYIFIPAWDGEEALTKIREEAPDLVLLDVNMPKKDGFQVLEEMRSYPASELIPVIVITAARIGPKDVRDGFSLGADDYVIKPFDWRELAARIQSKLRVKQAEDKLRRKYREFEILLQLGEVLRDQSTVDGIVVSLVNLLVDQFGVSSACLEVLADNGVVISRRRQKNKPATGPLQMRTGATAPSAVTQQVMLSGNWAFYHLDGSVQDGTENLNWREVTGAATPISRNGRLIGVLSLLVDRTGFFDHEHIHLLEAVSNFTALALQQAESLEHDRTGILS